MIKYFYRVERITHRPEEEDKITVVKEVREGNLEVARILATKDYLEELQGLQGKYSPASFGSYDTKKGIGYNYQLILLNADEDEEYVVESTMQKIVPDLVEQREEEKEIFWRLGLDYSNLEY